MIELQQNMYVQVAGFLIKMALEIVILRTLQFLQFNFYSTINFRQYHTKILTYRTGVCVCSGKGTFKFQVNQQSSASVL